MANKKILDAVDALDNYTETDSIYTIDEIRTDNCINIVLPNVGNSDDKIDEYEFVTINGKTTQIHKGEVVAVSWEIYEALKHSNQYKEMKILA